MKYPEMVWARVGRSKLQQDELAVETQAWLATEPVDFPSQYVPDQDLFRSTVQGSTVAPPAISVVISDAVYNLRSALDRFGYRLAVVASGSRRLRATRNSRSR
jgi:hypothetical protein